MVQDPKPPCTIGGRSEIPSRDDARSARARGVLISSLPRAELPRLICNDRRGFFLAAMVAKV
jgi:hypothetical protein